jgi:hypothetical protein
VILTVASAQKLDTHHKALTLNLDPSTFGSFAEIGAGQEVARWFLLVGGASGTVAKTISAYDKEVSDDLYGSGSRYVSKQRLEAMLDNEWTQLLTQLSKSRGSQTRFFCFVDTVSARNFAGTNDAHGWIGLQFQSAPSGPPNNILLHVNMRDPSNVLQQQAIGILGVNLIYAAFHEVQTRESFLEGLAEDVVAERIEIDYVDLGGPAFESWDRRALLVHLVRAGLAEAVFFSTALAFPLPRFSIRKPSCLHRDILATRIQFTCKFTCDCWLRAFRSYRRNLAKRNRRPRAFLPDGCSVHAKRASPRNSGLASSHRCACRLSRRRPAFSPTRALPHDSSGKPPYEGGRTFRRRTFPDDPSV